MKNEFEHWISLLCGQPAEPTEYSREMRFPDGGLGRSELNEAILAFRLDRMEAGLFSFIFKEDRVNDFETFCRMIEQFRILAAISFGNFKYAYKSLRNKSLHDIEADFESSEEDIERRLRGRHSPVAELAIVEPKDTYYMGYVVEGELRAAGDTAGLELMIGIRKRGQLNHDIYLDYDHMDVYVATSMREKFDFWNVARFTRELQLHKSIKDLNLRFFDPTQAYCSDRIDKGLVEGLMLKRAKCTIYMAGETETLGKDFELAATLAQGKTVIAYVPALEGYDKFRGDIVDKAFAEVYANEDRAEVALKFLKIYWPAGAWESSEVP